MYVFCRKQFHPSRKSANAYIVFATDAAAKKAVQLYVSPCHKNSEVKKLK